MPNKELSKLNEAELLNLYLKSKDGKALGALLTKYLPLIFATALHYLKNKTNAQDMCSFILEKMYKYLSANSVSNVKAFVMISTKNQCLTELKKEKHHVDITSVELRLQDQQNQDERILKEANLDKLEKCLALLKEEQRTCIELFYLKKQSYQQIVKATGLPLKKVKSNLQNGKRMLRNLMLENSSHE